MLLSFGKFSQFSYISTHGRTITVRLSDSKMDSFVVTELLYNKVQEYKDLRMIISRLLDLGQNSLLVPNPNVAGTQCPDILSSF